MLCCCCGSSSSSLVRPFDKILMGKWKWFSPCTIQRFSFRQIKLLPLIYDEWHKPLFTVHIIQVAAVFENETARTRARLLRQQRTTRQRCAKGTDKKKLSHRPIIHIINLVASMPSIFHSFSPPPPPSTSKAWLPCRAWYCTVIPHCYPCYKQ